MEKDTIDKINLIISEKNKDLYFRKYDNMKKFFEEDKDI